jgi:hypothetical protein
MKKLTLAFATAILISGCAAPVSEAGPVEPTSPGNVETGQLTGTDSDILDYMRVANESNVERFQHGKIEFEVIRSEKSGSGDLRDRKLADAIKAIGILIFDAENALLKVEFSDSDLIAGTKVIDEDHRTMSVMSRILLSDGSSTLNDTPVIDGARGTLIDSVEVYPEKNYSFFRSYAKFLYPVGRNDIIINRLADDLRAVQNGDSTTEHVQIDEPYATSGRLAKFTVKRRQGFTRQYVVDLDKGAIPVEIKDFAPDGTVIAEMIYGEIMQAVSGGWFPRAFRVNMPQAKISEIFVVKALDFANPPKRDDFAVRFREPVSFTDRVTSTFVRGAKDYSLINRKRNPPKNSVKVQIKGSNLDVRDFPRELPRPPYFLYATAATCMSLVALGTWRYLKKHPGSD